MSASHRKHKARELAFFRVKDSIMKAFQRQAEVLEARERGEEVANPWDSHRLSHADAYATARKEYRVGERLRPRRWCGGPEAFEACRGKRIAQEVVGGHRRGECVFCRTCADAKLTLRVPNPDACDGSGVLPAKRCAAQSGSAQRGETNYNAGGAPCT